jgi:splicing factor 3A subunit 1
MESTTTVIIPPPDIRAIIDKLAQRVSNADGYQFEQLILKHESDNPKFNFLKNEDDPYRPYYLKKLREGADQAKVEDAPEDQSKEDY